MSSLQEQRSKYGYIEKFEDGTAVLWMDLQDSRVNKLGPDLIRDFASFFDEIDADSDIQVVVIASKKKDFIAGADIDAFADVQKVRDFQNITRDGHKLLNRLASSKKPFVAAIEGAAMGGGLEVALACQGRVASDSRNTVLALPEVKIGVLPSGGGTQRLPHLIGLQKALDMMLTGKNIYSSRAKKYGLVDRIISHKKLVEGARSFALEILDKPIKRKIDRSFRDWFLECTSFGRSLVFKKSKEMIGKMTGGNYPAPFRILECVETGYKSGFKAGLEAEAIYMEELILTPESRQLVNIFFATSEKKKNPMKDKARQIDHLAMLGAGFMGAGIAEVSAMKGIQVTLKDIKEESVSRGRQTIWKNLEKKVRSKALLQHEAEQIMGRVNGQLQYKGIESADILIEAVFEDLNIKHQVLSEAEEYIKDDCIIASNTSALPISMIASKLKRPEQVIGLHYFSPVPKMPLLEIVITNQTADWVIATSVELGIRQGKTCIVVKDGPGFYTTRILAPLFNETLLLLEEGADILQLDRALKKFGFPVGPVTLLDEVGLDVGAHVMEGEIMKMFKQRPGAISSEAIANVAAAGYHGRKNKKGFFEYDPKTGKKVKGKVNNKIYEYFGGSERKKFDDNYLQDRCALAMVNEAARCLEEGIISTPVDGDIGAIFGLGFPPFRGGPFRYIDAEGASNVVKRLEDLMKKSSARFLPADIIVDKASNGKNFYQ